MFANRQRPFLPAVLLLAVPALAQAGVPVTQSLDPQSPEVTANEFGAGDLFVSNALCPQPRPFPWTRTQLGLPAGGNIDAFSEAGDNPPPTGEMPPPTIPGQTQVLLVNFSVDRTSVGRPFMPVATEAATDGAAGDTFVTDLAAGGGAHVLITDHQCLQPLPNQSNIDAICWSQQTMWPVYYSVDAATAAQMQGTLPGLTAGDVIRASAPGVLSIHRTAASLGLQAGDDIDALATDGSTWVFSLSRTSPSAIATPLVGSAGLFTAPLPGTLMRWAFAMQLGLNGGVDRDNLDAVRIMAGDPWPGHTIGGASIPGGSGCGGVGVGSDVPRLGLPMSVVLTAPVALAPGVLAMSVPNSLVTPLSPGCDLRLDLGTAQFIAWPIVAGGTGVTGLFVPNNPVFQGLRVRLQGGVLDGSLPGGIGLSNALTLIVGI